MPTIQKRSEQLLFIFLAIWTFLNILQAGLTEVHADEAYYWMYSRFLDWGYFDHPPMVALFMKLGDALWANTLGLRIFTVISSTLSVYLIWLMVKPYANNLRLFILLFGSVVLFHVYGFITTPDAPLFFFTVLFFYVYQRYATSGKLKWMFILPLVIAALLYSKYHGILVLFFTILSNIKLFKRPSFYGIILLALIAFLPHIWWQVQNNYPSFYYHVIDRSAAFYQFRFSSEYFLAQLALAGPLVGWMMYKSAASLKTSDPFLRALKYNFYGIFIFFLFSTLKGRVEAHWTLPGMLCLMMMAYIYMAEKTVPKWFERLAIVNIALIIVVRLLVVIPVKALENVKVVAYYFGNKEWAEAIHEKAGNAPVIFMDSFQNPSRYNYYTRSTQGFSYDSRYYRKNQYDLWPLEDKIQGQRAYEVLANSHSNGLAEDTIRTDKGDFYGQWIPKVRMYQKVSVNTVALPATWKANEVKTLQLKITNPYAETISLNNQTGSPGCYLEYSFKTGDQLDEFKAVGADLKSLTIKAGQTVIIPGTIKAPATSGKYKLILSIRTDPFPGARNSNMITVTVK